MRNKKIKEEGRYTLLLKGTASGKGTLDELFDDVKIIIPEEGRVKRVWSESNPRIYCIDCSKEEYMNLVFVYGEEPDKYK
ncbi:hypothetical protein [Novacetimonas sp. GS1]|uniref:hypothetical protein n=1 Tax=Novacetimonas sp. GS1 TaxID=3119990 RepID=UPI002FCD08B9